MAKSYSCTEEMVMREFGEGEISYRCLRVEMWGDGLDYPVQVGYVRLPHELFVIVRDLIEKAKCSL